MDHPYLSHIRTLGCSDEGKIIMAFQSYMKLSRENPTSDIQSFYCEPMDVIYLKSKEVKSSTAEVYVAISSEFKVSPSWIEELVKQLCVSDGNNRIILFIWDRDSSCLQYILTPGLIPSSSPEFKKRKLHSR